nr:ATP-binding protein [Campylobacterota bacterium]
KITEFNTFDELYFSDATFIESPIVLQLSESIQMSRTYFEMLEDRRDTFMRPNVPLHIKDLNDKLKVSLTEDTLFDVEDLLNRYDVKKLLSILSTVMGGKVKYSKKTRDYQYIDNNGKAFDSLNTATGVKSFGIIQMLIRSGIIDQRSLLILDEPEVHLHPKWQLKYAQLIVELVKNDINVLVTSHSPYMIQALVKYTKDADIVNKSNFYLATKKELHSNIENVNENLHKIFELLAEPMNEVYE